MLEKLPKVSYFINSDILAQNTLYCIIYFIDILFQCLNEKNSKNSLSALERENAFDKHFHNHNHNHQTRQNETNMI